MAFYLLRKLHDSQTLSKSLSIKVQFYLLRKLHDSQTSCPLLLPKLEFYLLRKLHDSQTGVNVNQDKQTVLLTKEIT